MDHSWENCKICRLWLVHGMVQPLRCGGLSFNDDGEYIARTGELWADIKARHEAKCDEKRLEYFINNQEHLEKYHKGCYIEYMAKKKKKKYLTYLEFLKTRLDSENYKARVTPEEYEITVAKYKKEKLLRKLLDK